MAALDAFKNFFNKIKIFLIRIYLLAEEKYYKLADFLQDKLHVPAYDFFVNPIEASGVPSFPIALFILFLVAVALAFFPIFAASQPATLTVVVQSNGKPVEGASVGVYANTELVGSKQTGPTGKTVFEDLPAGTLVVKASKQGFKDLQKTINFPTVSSASFSLSCASASCKSEANVSDKELIFGGRARLTITLSDEETGKLVDGLASVYDAKANTLFQDARTTSGVAVLQDVSSGLAVYVNVDADGYLPYNGYGSTLTLKEGNNPLSIKLTPLNGGGGDGCLPGASVSCTTTYGSPGKKTCSSARAFGECIGLPSNCVAGETAPCVENGLQGNRTCASGVFGECVVPGYCVVGKKYDCPVAGSGVLGKKTCLAANGSFGACEAESYCVLGQEYACARNCILGSRACLSENGFFGECVALASCTVGAQYDCPAYGFLGTKICVNASGVYGNCSKASDASCAPGLEKNCTIYNADDGMMRCDSNGFWGACALKPQCVEGQRLNCTLSKPDDGFLACDSAGCWGSCKYKPVCSEGQTMSCSLYNESDGVMRCDENGFWMECRPKPVCSSGATTDCTIPDGLGIAAGIASCNDNGFWSDCEPKPVCSAGEFMQCVYNQYCFPQNQSCSNCFGNQTCGSTGFWNDCANTKTPKCPEGANYGRSIVSVIDESKQPIEGAKVDLYVVGSPAPLLKDKLTNSSGQKEFILGTTDSYFAVASKQGFYAEPSKRFRVGENVVILLTAVTGDNNASLAVTTNEEYGDTVSGARVAVFYKTLAGDFFKLDEKTGASSTTTFAGLRRGIAVVVNASSREGTEAGSAEATLSQTQASNAVNVTLLLSPAAIVAFAFDMMNPSNALSNAVFTATLFTTHGERVPLGQCTGVNCTLTVKSKRKLEINASADGWIPNPSSLEAKLSPNETRSISFPLFDESLLKDSEIIYGGIVDAETGLPVGSLKRGHSYKAQFNLVTKNADVSGAHFSLEPQGIAWINSVSPMGGQCLGDASSESSGCADALVLTSDNEFGDKKINWVDVSYAYSKSVTVSPLVVVFTVDPEAQLDESTGQASLSLNYRSFIKRGDSIVRNPFDEGLGTKVDKDLESGCGAASFSQDFVVTGAQTTCNDFACVSLNFQQGDKIGVEGFNATSMQSIDPSSAGFKPLVAFYKIDFLKELGDDTKISFNAFSNEIGAEIPVLEVVNATSPLDGSLDGGVLNCFNDASVRVIGSPNSFSLDLSALKNCANYPMLGAFKYSFSGTIYLIPQAPNNRTDLTLSVSSGGQTASHDSWIRVLGEGGVTPSQPVESTLLLSQNQGGNAVAEKSVAQPAPSFTACNVSSSPLAEIPNCGFVNASFYLVLNQKFLSNNVSITVPDYPASYRQSLKVLGGYYRVKPAGGEWGVKYGLLPVGGHTVSTGELGELGAGSEVSGTIFLAPILPAGSDHNYAVVMLNHSGVSWDKKAYSTQNPRTVFVQSPYAQPTTEVIPWFFDDCGGFVNVSFNPSRAQQPLRLQGNCSTLYMRVSDVFPADAVPTFVDAPSAGGLLAKIDASSGGDASCFESCDYDPANDAVVSESCQSGMPGIISALTVPGYHVLRFDYRNCNDYPKAFCSSYYCSQADRENHLQVNFSIFPLGGDISKSVRFTLNLEKTVFSQTVNLQKTAYKQAGAVDAFLYPTTTSGPLILDLGVDKNNLPWLFSVTNNQQSPEGQKRELTLEVKPSAGAKFSEKTLKLDAGETTILALPYQTAEEGVIKISEKDSVLMQCGVGEGVYLPCSQESGFGNAPRPSDFASYEGWYEQTLPQALYWRSTSQQVFCQVGGTQYYGYYNCPTDYNNVKLSPDNFWACCKPSIDEWKNVTTVSDYKAQPCVFCNNSYWGYAGGKPNAPQCGVASSAHVNCSFASPSSQTFNCDERCKPIIRFSSCTDGPCMARVNQGESFFNGSQTFSCTTSGGCIIPACSNSCSDVKQCDLSCGFDGTKLAQLGSHEKEVWLNTSSIQTFQVMPPGGAKGFGEANKPFGFFTQNPKAKFSIPIDAVSDGSDDLSKIVNDYNLDPSAVKDCVSGANEINYKGIYNVLLTENVVKGAPPTPMALNAPVISVQTLHNAPDSYVGFPDSGSAKACVKGVQTNVFDSMKNVPLCAYLWADQSSEYGTCLNSIYSYASDSSDQYDVKKFKPVDDCASKQGQRCNDDTHTLIALKNSEIYEDGTWGGSCKEPCGFVTPLGLLQAATKYCDKKWKLRIWSPLGVATHCRVDDASTIGGERFYPDTSFDLSDGTLFGFRQRSDDWLHAWWNTQTREASVDNCDQVTC